MKKIVLIVISTLLLATPLYAAPLIHPYLPTHIFINGEYRASGFIEEGRTYLPLRDIGEALGITVGWNVETQTATLSKDGTTIVQKIGSPYATVNGETVGTDAPALVKEGKTYVPVKFVGQALGAKVVFDYDTRHVQITAEGVVAPSVPPVMPRDEKADLETAKYEAIAIKAKPFSDFPMQPITNYTTIDKVPRGNRGRGVVGPWYDQFSIIEQSQLPIRENKWNSILAIDTEILSSGMRVLVITREVGNRDQFGGIIYATQKKGFLVRADTPIGVLTETIAVMNLDGHRTYVVKYKYSLPDEYRNGVTTDDIEGIVFGGEPEGSAIMVRIEL